MKVAIDTRDLQIAKTGAQTYLAELCRALAAMPSEHEFIQLQPAWRPCDSRSKMSKILNHLLFFWWKEVELPLRAWQKRADIIFCTDYTVPWLHAKRAIPVFHDASFWANPSHYNQLWRKFMDLLTLPPARRAPVVITVSDYAKAQIAEHTRISAERIVPIYIAPKSVVRQQLTPAEVDAVLTRYGLAEARPYGLFVGVLEKRKNLPRFIEAFARFRHEHDLNHHFVLVGQPGPKADLNDAQAIQATIEALNLQQAVHLPGYVPDEDLPAFYQGAHYFAFPSTREGFGIPILEAYNSGIPVVAADMASIPEVTGDAAVLFDPFSIDAMADAIAQVSLNPALREELVARGFRQASQFDWNKTAQKIVAIFERVQRAEGPLA